MGIRSAFWRDGKIHITRVLPLSASEDSFEERENREHEIARALETEEGLETLRELIQVINLQTEGLRHLQKRYTL